MVAPASVERHRSARATSTVLAVGEREHLLDRARRSRRPRRARPPRSPATTRAPDTVETAQSTLRPRSSAIAVIFAIASFMTFSPIVPPMSSPWPLTGDAAPMLVPGAISAMFAGERDERARARREAAGRGDPDDHRDLRLEDRADDVVASRSSQPPGRVELDDDGRRRPGPRPGLIPSLEVLGHAPVDDAGRRQDDDLRAGAAQRRRPAAASRAPSARTGAATGSRRGLRRALWTWCRHLLRVIIALQPRARVPAGSAVRPRGGRTRARSTSPSVDDRRDLDGLGERARELVGLADRDGPARRRRRRRPRRGGRCRRRSCRRSAGRRGGTSGSKSATSSSRHSRRSPPARSPSPGFRWPPTPIDQRSWRRASPPARVRRIRK